MPSRDRECGYHKTSLLYNDRQKVKPEEVEFDPWHPSCTCAVFSFFVTTRALLQVSDADSLLSIDIAGTLTLTGDSPNRPQNPPRAVPMVSG